MRKFTCLLFILALAGCQEEKDTDTLLLNLTSYGEVKLTPNMASITATVSCTDKILDNATTCTKGAITRLFQLLEQNHIEKADYHSSRIDLEREYEWRNNSHIFTGYNASSMISITFRDLDAMTQVITGIMTMKEIELSNLDYSHSDIDAFVEQAYLNALDNANTLAEKMKDKVAGKSVTIMEISNNDSGFVTNVSEGATEWLAENYSGRARKAPAPIPVNPGELTLMKEVHVLYRVFR